jgi:hypothetical protein
VGLLVAVVLAVLFSVWERGTRTPLMDPGLLLRRPVAAGTAMLLVATALTVAVFFLGSFYLHEFGAAGGAAIVSSVAAASLTAQTVTGFRDAFLVCAIGAGVGAVLLTGLAPALGTAKA